MNGFFVRQDVPTRTGFIWDIMIIIASPFLGWPLFSSCPEPLCKRKRRPLRLPQPTRTMSLKSRITFYSLTLSFSCFQIVFGLVSSFFSGFSPYLYIFGKIAGGLAVISLVWTSVLLAYNNRPLSTYALTKSAIHLYSFTVLSITWLAVGIMVSTQAHYECNFTRYSDGEAGVWCGMTVTSGGIAFLTAVFAAVSAALVHRAAGKSAAGLQANVAESDKKGFASVS